MFYFVHFFKGLYVNFDSETLIFVTLISTYYRVLRVFNLQLLYYRRYLVIYLLDSIGDFHIITMKEDLCNMYSVKCK